MTQAVDFAWSKPPDPLAELAVSGRRESLGPPDPLAELAVSGRRESLGPPDPLA